MTTATIVYDTAVRLAAEGVPEERAVDELLACCGDKRVAVVLAREQVEQEVGKHPDNPVPGLAAGLLDRVLARLPI